MTQPAASPGTPAMSGARAALILLIVINLFNYIDRQVLAAVLPSIEKSFFPGAESTADSAAPDSGVAPLQDKSPTKQKLGYLQGAFKVPALAKPADGKANPPAGDGKTSTVPPLPGKSAESKTGTEAPGTKKSDEPAKPKAADGKSATPPAPDKRK